MVYKLTPPEDFVHGNFEQINRHNAHRAIRSRRGLRFSASAGRKGAQNSPLGLRTISSWIACRAGLPSKITWQTASVMGISVA